MALSLCTDPEYLEDVPGMHTVPMHTLGEGPWPELIRALRRFRLGAHHGKFDLVTLCIMLGEEPDALTLAEDTQLKHYTLYPGAGDHQLKTLAYRYFGYTDWGFSNGRIINLAAESADEVHLYNQLDAYVTWKLDTRLGAEMFGAGQDARSSYQQRLLASRLLQWMEPRGIAFERNYVAEELAEELSMEADQLKLDLRQRAHRVLGRTRTVLKKRQRKGEICHEEVEEPFEFNPGSVQQLQKLYAATGRMLESTDEVVMSQRAAQGDRYAADLLKWRKTNRLVTGFIKPWLGMADDQVHGHYRLYPSYKIHGTKSSRLSAQDPNLHQVPRDPRMRGAYGAAPGHVLVGADYGQGELRVMAAEADDEWLLGLFHDAEVDIFTAMMPDVFPHVDIAALSAAQRKDLRAKLKGVIYGLAFGRGPKAISIEIGSTVQEAKRIIDRFFTNAQGLAAWRQEILKKAATDGRITSRFGARFHFELPSAEMLPGVQRSALSHIPQGNLSDLNILSAWRIREHVYDHDLSWYVVGLIHDQVLLEVPEADAEQACKLAETTMVDTAAEIFPEVPFTADAAVGKTWAEV